MIVRSDRSFKGQYLCMSINCKVLTDGLHLFMSFYLARARMSPSPDPAEPVASGFVNLYLCPGMYRESSEPILLQFFDC